MKINDLKSIQMEIQQLKYKSKVDKENLLLGIKLFKYQVVQDIFKGFKNLF